MGSAGWRRSAALAPHRRLGPLAVGGAKTFLGSRRIVSGIWRFWRTKQAANYTEGPFRCHRAGCDFLGSAFALERPPRLALAGA